MVPVVTRVYPEANQINYTVDEGNFITFKCIATGIPAPEITWLRDGVELNSTSNPRINIGNARDPIAISRDDNETVLEVTRNLNLTNIVDENSGSYVCVATNIAGNGNDTFEVIVQGMFGLGFGQAKEIETRLTFTSILTQLKLHGYNFALKGNRSKYSYCI